MASSLVARVKRTRDDGDNSDQGGTRQRTATSILDRVNGTEDWRTLFEVPADDSTSAEDLHSLARGVRNRLLRVVHPDMATDPGMRDSFHAATVRINRLWDQASASLAPSGPSQETRPAPSTALRITMSGVVVEPGGSLEMLSRATIANPPAMLKRPGGDFYVGFGSLETLKGCRFLPMSTNRCISQDVVAQRVSENLARLREEGEYYDFGQISLVAVATPSSEQYVEEQPAAMSSTALVTDGGCSEGGRNRFARFYVLDGQHRLSTMIELARERPNVPIWFDLSIRVAPDKESANAALLHMQQTYRADPKCFFAADGEPYVSKRPPSLPPSTTARPHILCPPGCCPVCLRRGGRDCRAHTRSRPAGVARRLRRGVRVALVVCSARASNHST